MRNFKENKKAFIPSSQFEELGPLRQGKVRDIFETEDAIASRERFKPIRIGENLVVNYNG